MEKTTVYSEKLGKEVAINDQLFTELAACMTNSKNTAEWSQGYWNRELGDYWNRSW